MHALSKTCQHCNKPMNGGLYRASHVCPHCLFEHAGGRKSKKRVPINTQTSKQPHSTATLTASKQSMPQEPQENVSPEELPAAAKKVPTPEACISKASSPEALNTQGSTSKVNSEAKVSSTPVPNASKTNASVPDAPIRTSIKPKSKNSINSKVTLTAEPSHEQMVIRLFDEISATSILHIELTPDLFINGKFAGTKSPKIQASLKQGKKDVLGQIQKTALDLGANTVADIEVKNGMKMVDKKSAKITVTASGTALLTDTTEAAVNA